MLNYQDLRFLGESGNVIPQRAEVILANLQQYFVAQSTNKSERLMLRFRVKGGKMDSVRMSMNSDVIDVFTNNAVKKEVLRKLTQELDFDVDFIEGPYCFYLVKWSQESNDTCVKHIDHRDNNSTLKSNVSYVCDTTLKPFRVYLPRNAVHGDTVTVSDAEGTWSRHRLTVNSNDQFIFNSNEVDLDINFLTVVFKYIGHANKWVMDN